MIISSDEIEERAIERVAELMCVAARTAPKARGNDNLITMIVKAREKDKLSEEMLRIARQHNLPIYERDAKGVDKAALVVLLGQKPIPLGVPVCGYCGFNNCAECAKESGVCAVSTGDLGIAIGSAVSTAAMHRVDNRIMFSVGKAALNLEFFPEDAKIVYGIPLSVTGKNPFFDR